MLGDDELHKSSYLVVIITAICIQALDLILTCFFSGISGISPFKNGTLQIFLDYETSFTPQAWSAPAITVCLVMWQIGFVFYSISTMMRYTSYGYLYIAPGHTHPQLYICYSIGLVLHMVWITTINVFGPGTSIYSIPFSAAFVFAAYGISCHRLYYRGHILQREGAQKEALYVRLCTQNALAIHGTWLFFLTVLNLDMALVHVFHLDWEISGSIVHAFVLVYIVVWFFLDNFIFDKFLRYTFSPYLVFLLYLFGCVYHHHYCSTYIFAMTAFTLAIAVLLAVLKVVILVRNQLLHPLWLGNGFFVHHQSYGSIDHKSSDRIEDYY